MPPRLGPFASPLRARVCRFVVSSATLSTDPAPRCPIATATLVLETPQLVTLEATATNLRELVIPAGTRYLEWSSDGRWYYEPDTGQSDGNAGTAANQQRMPSEDSWRVPGSGAHRARLPIAKSIFCAGTSSSQQVWFTATARSP